MTWEKDPIRSLDFAGLYRRQFRRSCLTERSAADWDRRAAQRQRADLRSDYNRAVLARLDLTGARTLLDIGCGVGNLALPLARRLRRVYALDFSREMLRYLRLNARRAGIKNIVLLRRSWADSWRDVPVADVALCSRALGVCGLHSALAKMTRHARLRCYAVMHVGPSFLSPDVLAALRRRLVPRPDYIYAVNLLYQMGFPARVDFFCSHGLSRYEDEKAFQESVAWRVGALSRAERDRLNRFFATLPRDGHGRAVHRHEFTWAMLSWQKS